MGSSRQQTWCHKTLKAKKNHYSGNFLLLRPGGKTIVSLRVLIFNKKNQVSARKMLGTKPPKKWIGFRASSKKFQGLLLKSFEFNSCYSEQVVSKNQSSTEKQHVIYICYMRINCSDLNSIFQFFFASNLPHAVTLKHFFTCGACSPQIWWILLTSPDLSCIVGTLLHVWIPAISPPFLAIFSRNFYAYSRNFSGCIFLQEFLRLYFRISPFVFLISPVVVIVVGFCLFSYRHTVLIKVLKNKLAFGDQGI